MKGEDDAGTPLMRYWTELPEAKDGQSPLEIRWRGERQLLFFIFVLRTRRRVVQCQEPDAVPARVHAGADGVQESGI